MGLLKMEIAWVAPTEESMVFVKKLLDHSEGFSWKITIYSPVQVQCSECKIKQISLLKGELHRYPLVHYFTEGKLTPKRMLFGQRVFVSGFDASFDQIIFEYYRYL
jgi:hypothetical protein